MNPHLKHRLIPVKGFSLMEVAISVGIATISTLVLLGLVPYGLDNLHRSASRQAEARITQTISSHYQMTTWIDQNTSGERRTVLQDKTFFFDQTGTELTDGSHPDRLYTVQATLNPAIPRLEGDTGENPYLRRLTLRFTDRPDHATALRDNSGQYTERPVWIANIEQTGPLPP